MQLHVSHTGHMLRSTSCGEGSLCQWPQSRDLGKLLVCSCMFSTGPWATPLGKSGARSSRTGLLMFLSVCLLLYKHSRRNGRSVIPSDIVEFFTFGSGGLGSGLMWWLMTTCPLVTTNFSSVNPKMRMSSGVHCWRKLMPSAEKQFRFLNYLNHTLSLLLFDPSLLSD